MNTTSIIEKIDGHRMEDYLTLSKVIQIRKRSGFLVKISWLIHENQFKIQPGDYLIIFKRNAYFITLLKMPPAWR